MNFQFLPLNFGKVCVFIFPFSMKLVSMEKKKKRGTLKQHFSYFYFEKFKSNFQSLILFLLSRNLKETFQLQN